MLKNVFPLLLNQSFSSYIYSNLCYLLVALVESGIRTSHRFLQGLFTILLFELNFFVLFLTYFGSLMFSALQSLIIIGVVVGLVIIVAIVTTFFVVRTISARRERKRRDE